MSHKVLVFEKPKCIGCRRCELACSMIHKGTYIPSESLIRISRDEKKLDYDAHFCMHCEKPACVKICKMGAISKDPKFGTVSVDHEKCTGCRLCLKCWCGVPRMDANSRLNVICDLCTGDPECVKFCPQGALRYVPPEEARLFFRTN